MPLNVTVSASLVDGSTWATSGPYRLEASFTNNEAFAVLVYFAQYGIRGSSDPSPAVRHMVKIQASATTAVQFDLYDNLRQHVPSPASGTSATLTAYVRPVVCDTSLGNVTYLSDVDVQFTVNHF